VTAAHATTLLDVAEIRDVAAGVLAPELETDPPVLVDAVDSLTPPAIMLLWGDPWLTPGATPAGRVMGPCVWSARLHVLCLAGRVEPGPGIRTLEQLVGLVVGRLAGDTYTWPLETVSAPRVFEISGIAYLGARVGYLIPAAVGGNPS